MIVRTRLKRGERVTAGRSDVPPVICSGAVSSVDTGKIQRYIT